MSEGTVFILFLCGLLFLLFLGLGRIIKERPPEPKRKKHRKKGEIKNERSLNP